MEKGRPSANKYENSILLKPIEMRKKIGIHMIVFATFFPGAFFAIVLGINRYRDQFVLIVTLEGSSRVLPLWQSVTALLSRFIKAGNKHMHSECVI